MKTITLFLKRGVVCAGASLFSLFGSLFAQSNLFTWNLANRGGQTTAPYSTVTTGISTSSPSGVLSLGAGFNATNYLTNGFTANRQTATTLADAITGNDYFSFTITPNSGQQVSITQLRIRPISQNRTRTFVVMSSRNGFTSSSTQVGSFTNAVNGGSNSLVNVAVSNHNNLTTATEFRVYVYGYTDQYEAVGIGLKPSGSTESDLYIVGTVQAVSSSDTQAPSVPGGLTSSSIGQSSFTLAWNASTDNVGVTGYEVFRNGTSIGTTTASTRTFNVTGLSASTTYSMTVRARDAAGNWSAQSSALSVTTSAATSSTSNLIGININHPSDYQEDRAFADAMRTARDWKRIDGTNATLDANGWPTHDAKAIIWHGIDNMQGTYRLSFNGQANIATGFGSATVSNKVYDAATNKTTATLVYNSTDGAGLELSFTSSGSGVKNVKLMRPLTPGSTSSYSETTTFTTQIKNLIAKFSAIRFMDWSATNSNNCVNWSERVLPTQKQSSSGTGYGWQGRGGAWEYAIQLANETNKDMWICVPAKATNDYVVQLARLIKNGGGGFAALNSSLKVYVEYSNETWNTAGAFTQSTWSKDQAVAEVNAGGSPLNYDGETNQWNWAWRRTAKRIVEISNQFRAEFGDAAMMTRIRPVLMWQQNNGQSTASQQLNFIEGYYGVVRSGNPTARPVSYFLYAGGGSAYYNPDNNSDALTLSNIWSSATFDVNNFKNVIASDAHHAAAFGLKHIAYEGGPSLDNHGHSESVKDQAWGDSRMKTEVEEHHTAWSNQGADLLMYFTSSGSDYQWSFTRDIFNLNTPKLQAIDAIRAGTKASVTLGRSLPAQIDGKAFSAAKISYKTPGTGSQAVTNGEWFSYAIRTASTARYNVSITYKATASATIQVLLGTSVIANINVSSTGGAEQTTSAFGLGSLAADKLYGLRVKSTSGSFEVVRVNINSCTSCKQSAEEVSESATASLAVYPNPASDRFIVDVNAATEHEVKLALYSYVGIKVYASSHSVSEGVNTIPVYLSSLSPGVYILEVIANGKVNRERLVIE